MSGCTEYYEVECWVIMCDQRDLTIWLLLRDRNVMCSGINFDKC